MRYFTRQLGLSNGVRLAGFKVKRRFLGLMAISDQPTEQIDTEIERTAMTRVLRTQLRPHRATSQPEMGGGFHLHPDRCPAVFEQRFARDNATVH